MVSEKQPTLIAEVKTLSPFGYTAEHGWNEQFEVAEKHGDWVSVHTNPRWGGSFDLLRRARTRTTKPIVAKGLHESDSDVRLALLENADFVLVVGRIPSEKVIPRQKLLYEPLSLGELREADTEELKVVWNSRDPRDGSLKAETFADARQLHDGWLCHASNIRTLADVAIGADAALVGQHLDEYLQSLRQQ